MDHSKMAILKMLEEGKITADEAARLLEASGNNSNQGNSGRGQTDTKSFDELAGSMARKVQAIAKDMEPKFHSLTKVVVAKTADLADKITQSLDTPKTSTPYRPHEPVKSGEIQKFDMLVMNQGGELKLNGKNGTLRVKGYNGDTISVKVSCKPNVRGADMQLVQRGNTYTLAYEAQQFDMVAVDAFVPATMFATITLGNVGGNVEAVALQTNTFYVDTSQGNQLLQQVSAKEGKMESDNGSVTLENCHMGNITIENNNGDISVAVPNLPNTGYEVEAIAPLGDVQVGLANLAFTRHETAVVVAKTIDFDHAANKVSMFLKTSNATIRVR